MTLGVLPTGSLVKCGVILTCTSETEFAKFKRWHSNFTGTLNFYHEDDHRIQYVNQETDELAFSAERYDSGLATTYKYTLLIIDTEVVRLQTSTTIRFYKVLIVEHQVVRWISEKSFDYKLDLQQLLA